MATEINEGDKFLRLGSDLRPLLVFGSGTLKFNLLLIIGETHDFLADT